MNRSEVVKDVAQGLFEAERRIDEAYAALAALAGRLPAARADAGLAMKAGANAVCTVSDALSGLAVVRRTLAEAHDQFAVVQRAIGDRTSLTGGGDKPPSPDTSAASEPPPLRIERPGHLRAVDGVAAAG